MKKNFLLLLSLLISVVSFGQNVQKDNEIGEEANKQIIAQIGLYEHSSQEYLNDVGQKLVSNIDEKLFDYQFAILDMEVPNAMALPGGYVYFSRSILVLANSEDELAGVMGHEITHVHLQHARKAKNKGLFSSILLLPAVVLGSLAPGEIISAPFTASYKLLNAGYSRSNETESDHDGAILAAKSGYDPYGLALILHKISLDVKIETGNEEMSTWFDSHPYTPKRVKKLDKLIPTIEVTESEYIASDHKAFLDKLEGICIGTNPDAGIFQDNTFLHPVMNFSMAVPKGWKTINTTTTVVYSSTDVKSQLAFTLADTVLDPAQFSEEFMKEYNRHYTSKPTRNERLDINGYPAQILSFEKEADGVKIIASLLWLTRDNRTYQFIQIGDEIYSTVLEETANSLHVMSSKERNSIYQTVLHVVQPQEGETLEELSKRTGNVLNSDYTQLINNLKSDEKLSASQWIKIGIKEKY